MSFDLKLINGDIVLGSNSDLSIVENGEKLTQDILKIVTTELGANKRFPWYGCPITQSLIGQVFDTIFLQSVGTNQLRFSITNLERLQKEQNRSNQLVTAQEQIGAIQKIDVFQNEIDPRFFNINLEVLSKAFRRVPMSFSVSL